MLREAATRGVALPILPRAPLGWRRAAQAIHDQLALRQAEFHGLTPEQWSMAVRQWLASRVGGAEIRVRMKPTGFENFVIDGQYKTQFEGPGISGGATHRGIRMIFEQAVLGVPSSCRAVDRPVYGYLSGSDEGSLSLQQYGPVVLHLRPQVALRSTFTGADSLDFAVHTALTDPCFIPASMMRAEGTAIPAHDTYIASHAPPQFAQRDVDPLVCAGFGDLTSYGYAEAQVHGGLRLADVAAITLTLNAPISLQAAQRLADTGVHWRMTAGDRP
jgi:hypothetical protein